MPPVAARSTREHAIRVLLAPAVRPLVAVVVDSASLAVLVGMAAYRRLRALRSSSLAAW